MKNRSFSRVSKGRLLEGIGLYGGTFNPIHLGHLRTAWEIKEAFDLNTVIFIPAALPPHKKSKHLENAQDRVEMIRLAIAPQKEFEISDVELMRSGPSYTIDTIHYFKSKYPQNAKQYFIVGSDAFMEIHTWKSFRGLLAQIPFIVMVRPEAVSNDCKNQLQSIDQYLLSKISPEYRFQSEGKQYIHPEMMPVYIHEVTPINISSTKIREIIKVGKSIQFLVPNAVLNYIQEKGLYK